MRATPTDTNDVFFHREHGLLSVEPKRSCVVPFAAPISEWLANTYGTSVLATITSRLTQMEKRRNQLCAFFPPQGQALTNCISHEAFKKSFLPITLQYLVDLSSLLAKTHGASAGSI